MQCGGVTPILNVSSLSESFDWFERFGWRKLWDWGDPPGFGAVRSGSCEIFLCQDGQGGRGRSQLSVTTGEPGAEAADQGVWMSLWVDEVDPIHRACLERGIEVTHPPTDEPWGVREMHVRHPDGHVFRVGSGVDAAEDERGPLEIVRVRSTVGMEARLTAVLEGLARERGVTVGEVLEEIVLHSFEPYGGGVADPHGPKTHALISQLKEQAGLDYETHATRRFVEVDQTRE
ncbi:MAG: bleomycin resistance family protein [Gemmatimonadetes bacterium]|nr:bleomycin resistance family protein [Gemmatimonadota bacterium]NNM31823.1 bleomycin resistance family protein [Gemmatimonadota bacterium]